MLPRNLFQEESWTSVCSAKRKSPFFWKIVKQIDNKLFKRTFRLSCYQFRVLVGRLRPILDRNRVMADRPSGLIQAEVKTALLLRLLSGGNYNELSLIFSIQTSSFYDVFRRTLDALLKTLKLPGLTEVVEELKKIGWISNSLVHAVVL